MAAAYGHVLNSRVCAINACRLLTSKDRTDSLFVESDLGRSDFWSSTQETWVLNCICKSFVISLGEGSTCVTSQVCGPILLIREKVELRSRVLQKFLEVQYFA